MRPEVLRQEDRSRLSLQCESKIKNSYFGAGQQITYSRFQLIQVIFTSQIYDSCHPSTSKARILNLPSRPKQATTLGISIRPLSISGKSTFLQVQTRPMPKKNPEKEISERRPVHAKPKGPATDKPVLMPTEASSVSPSGLAPTRENYFRPRAPLNPETSTRPRSVSGKFVLLQVRTRYRPKKNLEKKDYWSDVLSRGSLLRMSNSGYSPSSKTKSRNKGQTGWEKSSRPRAGHRPPGIRSTYNARNCLRSLHAYSQARSILHIMQRYCLKGLHAHSQVLPEGLTRSLSGREHITYNARYCLRSLHSYSQVGSILNTNAKVLYSNSEFVQRAIFVMRHKA
ncbi:LOW QUALITY PROTEIN: hypothetical protein YC2023_117098 [Brassica napus]